MPRFAEAPEGRGGLGVRADQRDNRSLVGLQTIFPDDGE